MRIGIFCTNNYVYPLPEGVIYANQAVAGMLADALAEKGEDVTLFAPEGSYTKAKLVTFGMKPYSDSTVHSKYSDSYFYEHVMVAEIFRYALKNRLDIVHAHLRPFSVIPMAAVSGAQTLLTIHDNLYYPAYESLSLSYKFKNIQYAALSEAHQKTRLGAPWAGVVHNGIDLKKWQFNQSRGECLCFVGRLMPDKGVDVAVRVALKMGLPLKIAGSIYDEDKDFFETRIKPNLSEQIEYLGSVGPKEVERLYRSALALLMPIKWEEPFGLVMIEAMACGTPVIAFPRGAIPEIVVDGKTGYVVKDEKSMVSAVKKIGTINRRKCREWVEEKFSVERMASEYLGLYRKVLNA
ncbi:glycosyltransferase family 4 protein [Patescibacteria group bacterium]|nr:glycosyltransferase family 4 protein [Patescibacteria group bacterium]MBU1868363.1 glycosyltransferase family 4 protein [Patescibacteria group bacterium]